MGQAYSRLDSGGVACFFNRGMEMNVAPADVAGQFTDVAMHISGLVNAMWGFHVTALVAGMGWGMVSRSWKRGLSPQLAAVAGVSLFVFGAVNLYALYQIYERMNAALALAGQNWVAAFDCNGAGRSLANCGNLGTLFDRWSFHPEMYLAIDATIGVIMAMLLSGLGRKPQPDDGEN